MSKDDHLLGQRLSVVKKTFLLTINLKFTACKTFCTVQCKITNNLRNIQLDLIMIKVRSINSHSGPALVFNFFDKRIATLRE